MLSFRATEFDEVLYSMVCHIRRNVVLDEVAFDEMSCLILEDTFLRLKRLLYDQSAKVQFGQGIFVRRNSLRHRRTPKALVSLRKCAG